MKAEIRLQYDDKGNCQFDCNATAQQMDHAIKVLQHARTIRGAIGPKEIAKAMNEGPLAGTKPVVAGFCLYSDDDKPRKCKDHPDRLAIGNLYFSNFAGEIDHSSKTPACEECAKRGGYQGVAA